MRKTLTDPTLQAVYEELRLKYERYVAALKAGVEVNIRFKRAEYYAATDVLRKIPYVKRLIKQWEVDEYGGCDWDYSSAEE